MLLANKFFDLVIGIDFHATTSPPFNPVHPFIGFTLDISAYIPFIGATTFINKVPYGNSGTMGTLGTKAHIPLVGSFAMAPMVAHESTNFFGSMNTFVEGMRLSGAGFMVMSCNDVGVPLSMQPGTKGKKPKASLFAPTSVTIPIPKGSPVMVGGPYVPDLTAMLKSMAMGFGMGCIMKGFGGSAKKIAKLADAKNKQARDLMSGIVDDTPLPRGDVKINSIDIPKKTIQEQRRELAQGFYRKHGMDEDTMKSHIKAIDFDKPVVIVKIPPDGLGKKGNELIQYQKTNSDGKVLQGKYYTNDIEATPSQLGVSDTYNVPDNRYRKTPEIKKIEKNIVKFDETKSVEGLKSTSAKIDDTWSRVNIDTKDPILIPTKGGGCQIYIPNN